MVGELPAEYRRSFSVQLSTQHLVNIHIHIWKWNGSSLWSSIFYDNSEMKVLLLGETQKVIWSLNLDVTETFLR